MAELQAKWSRAGGAIYQVSALGHSLCRTSRQKWERKAETISVATRFQQIRWHRKKPLALDGGNLPSVGASDISAASSL